MEDNLVRSDDRPMAEKKQIARWLNTILLLLMGSTFIGSFLFIVYGSPGSLLITVFSTLFYVGLFILNRRGHVNTAVALLVGQLLVITTLSAYAWGGIHAGVIPAYFLILALAALLLPPNLLLPLALGSILIIWGLFLAHLGGYLPTEDLSGTLVKTVMVSIILGLTAATLRFTVFRLNAILVQVRTHEAELVKSEKRYRAIVEDQTELVSRKAPDGTLTFVNSAYCRFFGQSTEELIGQSILNFMAHKADRQQVQETFSLFTPEKPFNIMEHQETRADGSIAWLNWTARAIFDEQGRLTEVQSVGRDVTERKQAELALQEAKRAAEAANRAKSIFLANMSHELRTPLTAILGFSRLMAQDSNLTRTQRQNLETIAQSGDYLLSFLNEVLQLSKLEAGRMTIQNKSFNLPQLLAELQSMFHLQADKKGLYLKLEQASDIPRYVSTDHHKLRQVLINLLENAIKFTEQGGITVRVRAITPEKQEAAPGAVLLAIEVEDTGVGIAADKQESIFAPFGQEQKTPQGSGLSLAISREFVRLLGSDLTVQSPAPAQGQEGGPGSIFRFTIRVYPTEAASIKEPNGQLTRLVSDQEPDLTNLVEALPPTLLLQLEQAAVRLDMERIHILVAEVGAQEAAVGSLFAKLAEEFRYEEIAQYCQQARPEADPT